MLGGWAERLAGDDWGASAAWGALFGDALCRRLIMRFLLCRAVLALHTGLSRVPELQPSCFPALPEARTLQHIQKGVDGCCEVLDINEQQAVLLTAAASTGLCAAESTAQPLTHTTGRNVCLVTACGAAAQIQVCAGRCDEHWLCIFGRPCQQRPSTSRRACSALRACWAASSASSALGVCTASRSRSASCGRRDGLNLLRGVSLGGRYFFPLTGGRVCALLSVFFAADAGVAACVAFAGTWVGVLVDASATHTR